jgi:intracellular multiplication protein IcmD
MKISKKLSTFIKAAIKTSLILGLGFSAVTFAATPTAVSLSTIGTNVDTSVVQMARVFTDLSLIAGIGFVMASFFKFHQHKLNPQQVPISQGITLLLIGAGLMLFPVMLPTATHAVFGSQAISKVGGSEIGGLIGNSG